MGESCDVHSCPECRLGQLGPGIDWAGGESWDVHSCPECRLGQLGPGNEWELSQGENPGMSTVVPSVGWDN